MNEHQHNDGHSIPVVVTPQSTLVIAACGADPGVLLPLLEKAGLPVVGDSGSWELAQAAAWLAAHPQGHLVVLARLPSVAVAHLLEQDIPPNQAVASWCSDADKLLQTLRTCRRRATLLFAEQAQANPDALLDGLGQRLQMHLAAPDHDLSQPHLPSVVLRLLADNALLHSMTARNLVAELEATALPLAKANGLLAPAADQVFQEYRSSLAQPTRAARELSEENRPLLDQPQHVKQKIEVFTTEKQTVENPDTADDIEARLKDLQEENDLLLEQLHHVQEELERYYLHGVQSSSDLHDLEQRLRAAEETVEALYNSKSWKITKPLRVMLDLFAGRSTTR